MAGTTVMIAGIPVPLTAKLSLCWDGPESYYRTWDDPTERYLKDHPEVQWIASIWSRLGGNCNSDASFHVRETANSDAKDHDVSSHIMAEWGSVGRFLQLASPEVLRLKNGIKVRICVSQELTLELLPRLFPTEGFTQYLSPCSPGAQCRDCKALKEKEICCGTSGETETEVLVREVIDLPRAMEMTDKQIRLMVEPSDEQIVEVAEMIRELDAEARAHWVSKLHASVLGKAFELSSLGTPEHRKMELAKENDCFALYLLRSGDALSFQARLQLARDERSDVREAARTDVAVKAALLATADLPAEEVLALIENDSDVDLSVLPESMLMMVAGMAFEERFYSSEWAQREKLIERLAEHPSVAVRDLALGNNALPWSKLAWVLEHGEIQQIVQTRDVRRSSSVNESQKILIIAARCREAGDDVRAAAVLKKINGNERWLSHDNNTIDIIYGVVNEYALQGLFEEGLAFLRASILNGAEWRYSDLKEFYLRAPVKVIESLPQPFESAVIGSAIPYLATYAFERGYVERAKYIWSWAEIAVGRLCYVGRGLAASYVAVGRIDDAFRVLEASLSDSLLRYNIYRDHKFFPLHGDPRWKVLIEKSDPVRWDEERDTLPDAHPDIVYAALRCADPELIPRRKPTGDVDISAVVAIAARRFAEAGDAERAEKTLQLAVRWAKRQESAFKLVCEAASLGFTEVAFTELQHLAGAGFESEEVQKAPELESLRADVRWRELAEKLCGSGGEEDEDGESYEDEDGESYEDEDGEFD